MIMGMTTPFLKEKNVSQASSSYMTRVYSTIIMIFTMMFQTSVWIDWFHVFSAGASRQDSSLHHQSSQSSDTFTMTGWCDESWTGVTRVTWSWAMGISWCLQLLFMEIKGDLSWIGIKKFRPMFLTLTVICLAMMSCGNHVNHGSHLGSSW